MKPKIAIVNSSSFGKLFPEHLERLNGFADVERVNFSALPSSDDLIQQLRTFHGIIVSVSPRFSAEVFEGLPKLVVLARHGIGFDNVDVKAASRCGVAIARVPGLVEQEAVAEHTIALMLAATRQLSQAYEAVRRGAWSQRAQFIGIELRGQRIGLVGLGNVGRRVATILKNGFGSEVVAFDPFLTDQEFSSQNVTRVTFEELLKSSTIISLHCALNQTNHRCLGEREFSMMRRGVIIVNTARGELLDETALEVALSKGFVGAYSSDVVEGAPIGADHPLLKFPNVVMVPHLGAYTIESLRGMGETMVDEMERVFVHHSPPSNLIDREVLQTGLRAWG